MPGIWWSGELGAEALGLPFAPAESLYNLLTVPLCVSSVREMVEEGTGCKVTVSENSVHGHPTLSTWSALKEERLGSRWF